jgi:hypothetical protein
MGHGKDTAQPKTVSNKLQKPIVSVDEMRLPVVVKDTSTQGQALEVSLSFAKEGQLRKLPAQDTDVIQMQGCGYGKTIRNRQS